MTGRDASFWHRPNRENVMTGLRVLVAASAWFGLVFGGSEMLTAHRSLRVPIHFGWEQQIPLVPGAVWVYMSIFPLLLMAPFVLRTPREIVALGLTHATVIATAAIGFLALPAQLGYPAAGISVTDGMTAALYRVADALNLDYNLLPSLHVALGVSCVAIYAPRARGVWRALLWIWAAAIGASTLLTHFHHVLDVVTGFALGLAGARSVYRRVAARETAFLPFLARLDSSAPPSRRRPDPVP